MKTTFDLPEPLLRRAKAAAAHQGRPLRDLVAEAIDAKLSADLAATRSALKQPNEWETYKAQLVQQPDGSWFNPNGIDDERFFQALEDIRAESRRAPLRNPFADFLPEDLAPADAAPGSLPAVVAPEKAASRPRKAAAALARKSRPR